MFLNRARKLITLLILIVELVLFSNVKDDSPRTRIVKIFYRYSNKTMECFSFK